MKEEKCKYCKEEVYRVFLLGREVFAEVLDRNYNPPEWRQHTCKLPKEYADKCKK